MADTADRTLPATPRRREAARRAGSMPDAAAPAWAAAAGTMILLGPAWLRATVGAAADMLRAAVPAAAVSGSEGGMCLPLLLPTVGLVLAAGGAGLAVRFLLDGVSWQPGRVAPDLERIDPVRGLARVLSGRTLLASLGQGLGLALLVMVAVWAALPLAGLAASGAALDDPGLLLAAAWRPLAWLVVAGGVVSVARWALARRRFERAIRMTPQEFADESRGLRAEPRVRLLQRGRPTQSFRRQDAPPDSDPRPAPGSRSGR